MTQTQLPAAPPESPRTPNNSAPPIKLGFALIGALIALEAIMIWATGGRLRQAHEVALYIGVALITGIAFWLFTPGSTGELNLPELGIKLGGGAAIGAIFMLLASWLTSPAIQHVVVPVPAEIPQQFTMHNLSPDSIRELGELRTVSGNRFLFAEFWAKEEEGAFQLTHLSNEGAAFKNPTYRIGLDGVLQRQNDEEDKE